MECAVVASLHMGAGVCAGQMGKVTHRWRGRTRVTQRTNEKALLVFLALAVATLLASLRRSTGGLGSTGRGGWRCGWGLCGSGSSCARVHGLDELEDEEQRERNHSLEQPGLLGLEPQHGHLCRLREATRKV